MRTNNPVGHTIVLAKRTPHTVRGRLVLAFGHDVGVVPNAALGMLDPRVTRVAMSLLVVAAGCGRVVARRRSR